MRQIKFRVWDEKMKKMLSWDIVGNMSAEIVCTFNAVNIPMQFTGLKDKNGLKEVYEGDIIDVEGNIKRNIYENKQETTDFVIQGFGTKDWCATYQKAMELGLKNSQ
jgi:hypothetical protein